MLILMTKKRSVKKGHGQKNLSEWNESFLLRDVLKRNRRNERLTVYSLQLL
jgi:hypothetical protein